MKVKVIIWILCLGATMAWGQGRTADTTAVPQRPVRMVHLIHSDSLCFDQDRHDGAKRLLGDVIFRHDNALMFCDSAYYWQEQNSFQAWGHVRLIQGDSVMAFGDRLVYDGNLRTAHLYTDVRLIHRTYTTTVLAADSIVYDRNTGVARYERGGVIRDDVNTLRSVWGEYTMSSNQAVFRRNVHLKHTNFTLAADTLYYNTSSHIAKMAGPTNIEYENETHIYTTRGWYNTETEQSMLLDRSIVTHQTGQTMTSDTIFYDKRNKFGRLYGQMHLTDSTQHKTLYGHYGEMWEQDKRGYVTGQALCIDWSQQDDWTYLHADTLRTEDIPYLRCDIHTTDSLSADSLHPAGATDTVWVDTVTNRVRAYRHVRLWRHDAQGVCDSLCWIGGDSTLMLYQDPVCWNQDQQISADSVRIWIHDGGVRLITGMGNAIAIRHEIRDYYTQSAAKELIAYIQEDTVRQIDLNGNAMTIFFPKEDDGSYVGMNTTESNFIKIYLRNQEVEHLVFTNQTQGMLYPMQQIDPAKERLSGFFLAQKERPRRPGEVLYHPKRTPRPKATVSATGE